MTPAAAISALDRGLVVAGEDVVLRRKAGTQAAALDVTIRAVLRGWTPSAQEGFAAQGETLATLSPTEMERRQWCWPPVPGDTLVTRGIERRIRGVNNVRMGDALVRIELAVIGDDLGR